MSYSNAKQDNLSVGAGKLWKVEFVLKLSFDKVLIINKNI